MRHYSNSGNFWFFYVKPLLKAWHVWETFCGLVCLNKQYVCVEKAYLCPDPRLLASLNNAHWEAMHTWHYCCVWLTTTTFVLNTTVPLRFGNGDLGKMLLLSGSNAFFDNLRFHPVAASFWLLPRRAGKRLVCPSLPHWKNVWMHSGDVRYVARRFLPSVPKIIFTKSKKLTHINVKFEPSDIFLSECLHMHQSSQIRAIAILP